MNHLSELGSNLSGKSLKGDKNSEITNLQIILAVLRQVLNTNDHTGTCRKHASHFRPFGISITPFFLVTPDILMGRFFNFRVCFF
jgi:hypothetical protein